MHKILARRFAPVFLLVGLVSGCATSPTHPALQGASLPDIVPVRRVVANIDHAAEFQLSPDGKRLLWARNVGFDVGLAVKAVGDNGTPADASERHFATGHLARPLDGIGNFGWLADSRHAFYLKDVSGAENTQIIVIDTDAGGGAPWDVTANPAARSFPLYFGAAGTGAAGKDAAAKLRLLFASNQRERGVFDVYEADVAQRQVKLIERNDGSILHWIVDTDGQVAARIRQLGPNDGALRMAEIRDAAGGWRAFKRIEAFDTWHLLRIDRGERRMVVISNIGRDKTALFEVDLASGAEKLVYEHAQVDIGWVQLPRSHGAPYAVLTFPDYSRIDYLDAPGASSLKLSVEQALESAKRQGKLAHDIAFARPHTVADDGKRLIVRAFSAAGNSELLVDRASNKVSVLRAPDASAAELLAPMRAFAFKASDGLTIPGYLLRPLGVDKPAPLVVDIHGGPWVRDYWQAGEFSTAQLLANRGYAVMRVNYRGSAGYGRAFMAAGARQTATRLQQDIAEAVQWAIDQGIADRERIAVFGGSFGGFSTLMQLIDKPHPYACGVNVVGVANWPRIFDTWPAFWRNRHYFEWFYGKADDPAAREEMWRGSPISRIDRITAPLLVIHGANDVRVVKQDSDDVVAALKALDRPVEYLVFDNEGHQIRRWRNRLAMWRHIEDFLAQCLGGRSNGFDWYQLMPR